MRHPSLLALVLGTAAFLTGCAGTTKYQDYPELSATAPTAVVHVMRTNTAFGAAVTAPVYLNKYLIGRIGPGGHLTTRVPAGRVHITSTTSDAVIQAEPDREYFFELTMPAHMWMYSPDFVVRQIAPPLSAE